MRGVIFVLLLGFGQWVMAITKCELQGKVIYKTGSCPKNATAKVLVKGHYVEAQRLQAHRLQRAQESDVAFARLNEKIRQHKLRNQQLLAGMSEQKEKETEIVKLSGDSGRFQLRKVKEQVNASPISRAKWLEMESELKANKQALQQLQAR